MPLSDEQKLDAFERYVKRGRRRPSDGRYTTQALTECATAFRLITEWGATVDAEWLVHGLRARFNAASQKTRRETNAARKRAAAKKTEKLHAQLRRERERPEFDL